MTRLLSATLLLVLLVTDVASSDSAPARFSSGNRQVALLELYTSEGCSSCPPADRWLSGLKGQPDLWSGVVPVAFHVDYWDYIGWRDRFASPEFSDRQRRYEREGGVNTVYTPGMFKDGHEWRGWFWNRGIGVGDRDIGNLAIELEDGHVSAHFDALESDHGELVLHVALLGMSLETRVGAGENNGRTLRHDFVVLGHGSAKLAKDGSRYSARTKLPRPRVTANDWAVAAWVSTPDRQAPIQATGGYLASRR